MLGEWGLVIRLHNVLAMLIGALIMPACLAMDVSGLDLTGYANKVVLLDFWASWCGPCRESFPWMQEMATKYQDRGLVVVGVNLDKDTALARDFLEKHPVDFQLVFNPGGDIAERYQLSGMPSSLVLDRSGRIRGRHRGFRLADRAQLEKELEALLDEAAPTSKP